MPRTEKKTQNQIQKHLALIVDDEPDICELLEMTLNRMDINTISAGDLKTANKHLHQQKISICLTDMRLPDGNGMELVKNIQKDYAHIPVAMISAHGNMDTAIEAMKLGAFDFVSKPVVLAELRNLVNAAISLAEQNSQTKEVLNSKNSSKNGSQNSSQKQIEETQSQLLGNSEQIDQVRQLIVKLSKSQAPVFISGCSGTGKELAAKCIHFSGPRASMPFVPINCGAIPSELMESEFFGHKKGSFTGAIKDKQGLFRAADGGTLFLDEVADLPASMQVKLLRAIQEKAIRPVGEEQEYRIDVRIISATHKDLNDLVSQELFRQDLYYRINVIELIMPSLAERTGDIKILTQFFLGKLSAQIKIKPSALQLLENYDFPGNVRELENILERATTLCENFLITESDLQLPKTSYRAVIGEGEQEYCSEIDPISGESIDSNTNTDIPKKLLPSKSQLIEALGITKWNRKAAASKLGISYRQLRYRLKKLGLE